MNPFRKKPAKPLPVAFAPASTMSDIKRGEYARDIRRHEQSLAAREKQIASLIEDQKDEMDVLRSIRMGEACLNGPAFEAKVEKLLAEEIGLDEMLDAGFDPDPTGASDALVEVEKSREEAETLEAAE